jgi:hypothetical protein
MKTQFHINGIAREQDRTKVEQILIATAERFGMLDTTVTSRVPDTIRGYSESIRGGLFIGARIVGNIIIVDISEGKQKSLRYSDVEQSLAAGLQERFGNRVSGVDEREHIPPDHSLPVPASDAAKEFWRKHLPDINSTLNPKDSTSTS